MHVTDHNNKTTRFIPILGSTASLTAGQPLYGICTDPSVGQVTFFTELHV